MAEKLYTLRLTGDELYYLQSGYEASILSPETKNEHERSITQKLDKLEMQRGRDRRSAKAKG